MQLLGIQSASLTPLVINGREVLSGIRKKPLAGRVRVSKLGLVGDQQADLSVHGGLRKALYAFPVEHYPYWQKLAQKSGIDIPLPYGFMGENLTLQGLLEEELFVGDEIHFEHCILRLTQPREPCFKLNAVFRHNKAARLMAETGFCGFYLSVIKPGSLEAGESFTLVSGARSTAILSLFRVSKAKTRNDPG